MSKSPRKSRRNPKKFIMFVKTVDENGFNDEENCGWLRLDPHTELVFSMSDAAVFEEKSSGHGSFEDWKKFFEEEHKNWRIVSPPKYL